MLREIASWTAYDILVQAIGGVCTVLLFISFQAKGKKLLVLHATASFIFALHLTLSRTPAWTGAILCALHGVRGLVYARARNPWSLAAFLVCGLVFGHLTWADWRSALVMAGSMLESYALWQTDERWRRRLNIIPRPLWFTYNYLARSVPGLLNEAAIAISILIAMWRYDRKPM